MNLKKLRKLKKLSQRALAEQIGVTKHTIFHIEKGTFLPKVETLINICEALECTPNDVLGFTSKK